MMLSQVEAQIFLASERNFTKTPAYCSYTTFCTGKEQPPQKRSRRFYSLTDETLAAGQSTSKTVLEDSLVVLLPLAGVVELVTAAVEVFVTPGQLEAHWYPAGSMFSLHNHYENETINYLLLWLKMPAVPAAARQIINFDLDAEQNRLITIAPAPGISLSIGKYKGRAEASYPVSTPQATITAFVIRGAFELENRLVEDRDGLTIWNTQRIEWEALSNDAILLLVEVTDENQKGET